MKTYPILSSQSLESPASPIADSALSGEPTTPSISHLVKGLGFDEAQLQESLTAVSSDPKEALALLLETYLIDADKLLHQICEAVESSDFETLRFAAHTLKSSSALMGMTGLSQLCQHIEQQARDRNPTGLKILVMKAEMIQTHGHKFLLSYQPSK